MPRSARKSISKRWLPSRARPIDRCHPSSPPQRLITSLPSHKNSAPAALGPYSQAIRAGSTLYVSGQIGLVPGTKDFAGDGVEAQAEQVMKNMGAILEAAGASYKHVVKTTILLAGERWGRCAEREGRGWGADDGGGSPGRSST